MSEKGTLFESARVTALKLLAYCQENDWAGYDPYDALNSRIFKSLPFLNFRLPRIALTQILKRSPVNVRPLLLIPKTQNPKAIALFLTAFLKLERLGLLDNKNLITFMTQKLVNLRSPINPSNSSNSYWCWGYSFPWQTRTILVPRWAPNLVCTTFVGNALLDAYDRLGESRYLDMAVSAAEYILDELFWTEGDSTACLSYPVPSSRARVHNANFLGAAFLCRVHRYRGDKRFLECGLRVARYSVKKQLHDGSWYYGELPTQRWVDNFHTGYNLCALRSICQYAEILEFESNIRRGFEFYRNHFFMADGAPKYFHNRAYPIDSHSVAQSIITLLVLRDLYEGNLGQALSVFDWSMTHMWDEQGYSYYQVSPVFNIRISYMRWSQAWMLLALSTLLEETAHATVRL